jgi:glycine cleavage system H protein
MEGYSYTNIFETKGIEYLAIIAFFLLLIPFWLLLNKKVKARQIQKALGILSANILRIPQGLFYSKNHTWAHLEESGAAKVGLDDLLLHITGEVKINNLRNPGYLIKKGEVFAEIDRNGKKLKVLSPISGEILKTNTLLNENPEIINQDPYSKGWVYKIKPSNWIGETNSYYFAEDATNWSRLELQRFKDFLVNSIEKHSTEPLLLTLQDGGELTDNTLSELSSEIWQDFEKDFLNQ